jgi:hypothetical protein
MRAWVVHSIVVLVERRHWLAGRIAALAVVLATTAFGLATWKVGIPYAAHYRLQDRTVGIVRTHAARSEAPGDTPELRSALMHAVREQGLEARIRDSDFMIEWTTIRLRVTCLYSVTVQILPGVTHTFPLRLHVEEPVLPKHKPIFL